MRDNRAPAAQERRTGELLATAKRLRQVRAAGRKFLALWALENDSRTTRPQQGRQEKLLADPMNHDWSLLYFGSVLDD